MAIPTIPGQIDPSHFDWVSPPNIAFGYAVAHLVGALFRLIDKLLARLNSTNGNSCTHDAASHTHETGERRAVTLDKHEECRRSWEKELQNVRSNYEKEIQNLRSYVDAINTEQKKTEEKVWKLMEQKNKLQVSP